MKYIKYGFYSITRNTFFNVLIMVEIAVIFVVCNITVAASNSRHMFMAPYDEIANSDGYIYVPMSNKKIMADYDPELIRDKMYSSLEGDVSVTYSYNIPIADAIVNDAAYQSSTFPFGLNFSIYALNEKFFSKFRVPLSSGRWPSAERNAAGQIEAVVALDNDPKLKIGDVVHTTISLPPEDGKTVNEDIGDIIIVGTIDYGNYYPSYIMSYSLSDVIDLYDTNAKSKVSGPVFIVSASAEKSFENKKLIGHSTAFITYNSPPTDQQRENNEILLGSSSEKLIKLSSFRNKSYEYIYEQSRKLLPIILGVLVIVLAELICSVAMNTKSQIRNYGIYFLCGCRWKGCLKISLAYSAIILLGGTILGAGLFAIFHMTEYSTMFEQNFEMNNIYVTLAIFLVMLVISLIVPYYMVHKTSPVETIKEN